MLIGNKDFDLSNHTYIMGILNVTPDSFSDGGTHNSLDTALKHTERMINEGMDIVDIGGESTRPGYTKISDEEELERIVPVIHAIKGRFDVPISIDTYKSGVAKEAITQGADLINDIWGLKYDSNMAKVIADADVPCVLMHNRDNTDYTDFIKDTLDDLNETLKLAIDAGISKDRIILDPGVGFAKDYAQNLAVLNNLAEYNKLGYPMLLGSSRKSVIGNALDLPVNERLEGTITTSILAGLAGYGFVRVHDSKENQRALKMLFSVKG